MLNKTNLQELAKQIFSDSNPGDSREHIPPYMMHTIKRNSGFFFGIKRFHSHWLHEDNEYYISRAFCTRSFESPSRSKYIGS